MKLFIRTLNGFSYNYDVDIKETVLSLKKMIEKDKDVYIERLRLIFCGQLMEDEKCLSDYSVEEATNIHLFILDEVEFWEEKMKCLISEKNSLEDEIKKLKEEKDLQLLNEQKNEINELKAIEKIKEEYAKLVKNMNEGEIKINFFFDIYTPCCYHGGFRSFEFNLINKRFDGLTPSDNSTIKKIYPEIELVRFASHIPFCKKMDVKLLNSSNIASFNYINEKHCLKINSTIPNNKSGRTMGTFEITLYWSKK